VNLFAFYGRVSTEDQQDPTSSKGWQLSRAMSLIEPHEGVVVEEFFDIGQSRSLPWKRRPEAAALLDAIKDPARGFDAVVIGEPARAFYGGQFGLTFPVFVHYGVELWVPEVGGRVDPGSDAHDLVMSLYGGMSKGERNRIKIRVRSAMAAQAATEGRFLGGRPPYGYVLGDAGPHPNPSKASDGKRLRKLERDPVAAPFVERIFAEYLGGSGLYAIAEGLTRDGVPSPSAHDPARNRHRAGSGGAWSKSAVRAILRNPRYTGRQVWNRQRRDEVLVDVEDVALGHETKLRWNERGDWVWSIDQVHEALIDPETFAAAQEIAGAGRNRPTVVKRPTDRPYVLRGLIRCSLCGRRMNGSWNHGAAHYRCKFAAEYALAKGVDHPRTVYVREAPILERLDRWLSTVLDEQNLAATVEAMAAASAPDEAAVARAEAARRRVADCDARLAKYRTALEAGADAVIVAGWVAEVKGDRLAAEQELAATGPDAEPLSTREVRALVEGLRSVVDALAGADPRVKAELYAELGVEMTFDPASNRVEVLARPSGVYQGACRRGDLNPHALAGTSPSSWRVCLFRHSDVGDRR
jgi:site-specific DNA recombinase